MNKFTILVLISFWALGIPTASAQNWQTHFEDTWGTETVTYEQGIAFLRKLADNFPQIQLKTYGTTDIGLPLHLAIFSPSGEFDAQKLKAQGKNVLMINNGIHPGEPDGIDATLMLFRDYALDKNKAALLENTVLVTIPFYNVGGALNRGEYRRANQNGPTSYGFRGNSRNLDLNRDFIKADSRNVRTFMQIFQEWDPDVFVDNHVSNGADYQYVLTYLATQADKLGGALGKYMRSDLIPDLKEKMRAQEWDICPYVNVYERSPIPDGYTQFYDAPRYSSGYAALFQSLGFINETHMLKPFDVRVQATYSFMESIIEHLKENGPKIREMRATERKRIAEQKRFALHWQLRRDTATTLVFKGYKDQKIASKVTSGERLKYNPQQPITAEIPFYEFYQPALEVEKPRAYIIPQSWHKIIALMQENGVKMQKLAKPQEVPIIAYYIEDFETRRSPYEGHYPHYNTKVRREEQSLKFRAGDYVIYTNQPHNRYIVETLEPQGYDSFFNWNYFDIILQQKEGYSAYVFEDYAEEMLKRQPDIKKKFEARLQEDEAFANNPRQQLNFLFRQSPHFEPEFRRYPIFRLESEVDLDLD